MGVAAFSAASTTAARHLWSGAQARRANQPRLKVTVMEIIYPGEKIADVPSYVAVRLTNIGNVPVRLHSTCFSWRVPFGRSAWLARPMDEQGDRHVPAHRYPFALLPNTSDTIFLEETGSFNNSMPRILHRGKLPPTFVAKWIRAFVYTDGGQLFRASLDGTIRKQISAIAATPVEERPQLSAYQLPGRRLPSSSIGSRPRGRRAGNSQGARLWMR